MATPIPQNRAEFTLLEVAQATRGEVVVPTGVAAADAGAVSVCGVTTDSRRSVPGELFVALTGESFDGHAFAAAAVRAGARAVLVERRIELDVPQVVVSSTLDALGELAALHRRRWGKKLVAVAGSAGKTTTRRVTMRLLTALFPGKVHASDGNLNNRIGVPMVLFGLLPEHEIALIEIGTNLRGEVGKLARISEPDVAVLTLIDLEHAEGIGDLDQVEAEEGDLLAAIGAGAAAVVNGDDVRVVRQLARSGATRRIRYGFDAGNDVCAVSWQSRGSAGTRFRVVDRGQEWGVLDTTLLGRVGALSVLAALSVAKCLTDALPPYAVAERCFSAPDLREPGRMTPVRLAGEVLVIDDTYNANPRSVKEALIAAAELAREGSRRLVLVLGEMRELGTFSRAEHEALGEAAADSGADLLFGLAGDARWLVDAARAHGLRAEYFADVTSALDSVKRAVRDGDVVLVKASRGVRAEGIVRCLVEDRGLAA